MTLWASSRRFTYRSNIFFNKRQIEKIFDRNPAMAMEWSAYMHGAVNITREEIKGMSGNELSILQYATEQRYKMARYNQASAIALAFGGKEGS